MKRVSYIDAYKSIGILLMVLGHIGLGQVFDIVIHTFHMPMFFVISGYLFKCNKHEKISITQYLMKKAKALLVPYICCGMIIVTFLMIMRYVLTHEIQYQLLFHLFWVNTNGLYLGGALWFLTALFVTDVCFFMCDRYLKGTMFYFVVFVFTAMGMLMCIFIPQKIPFAIPQGFVGVGFFLCGKMIKQFDENNKKKLSELSWWHVFGMGVIITCCIYINEEVNLREGVFGNVLLFWINAVLSSLLILNLAKRIDQALMNTFVGDRMHSIGKNSIVYLCLNQSLIWIASLFSDLLFENVLLNKAMVILLTFFGLYLAESVLCNTKLKVVFGK